MTTARNHTPSKTVADLEGLRRAFSIDLAREVVQRVGLPALLDDDLHDPGVVARAEDMIFAQLAYRLNNASFAWGWDSMKQTSASPKMKAELADRIAAKCAGLLTIMRGDDGELLDSLGPGGLWAFAAYEGAESGKDAVSDAMEAVSSLQRWALAMSDREGPNEREEQNRRPDEAFSSLLGTLGGMFFDFWRRAPGVSRPDQVRPDGPFFRFVAAVSAHLDLGKSDEALATAIERHEGLGSLRKFVRDEWQ